MCVHAAQAQAPGLDKTMLSLNVDVASTNEESGHELALCFNLSIDNCTSCITVWLLGHQPSSKLKDE